MTFEEFKSSLKSDSPPKDISNLLIALWYEAKGNQPAGQIGWEKAHKIAQDINDSSGAWVHAYLHRKEGDKSNAGYWYSRAGKPFPDVTPSEEWEIIVTDLLKK